MKTAAEPNRRLSYQNGQWVLEVTELVRVDRSLYRPERRKIQGTEAIFEHLHERGEMVLLAAAERVLFSHDTRTSYEAVGGEWVEADLELSPPSSQQRERLADEVAELRAELVVLSAAYTGLAARLRQFEHWAASTASVRPSQSAATPPPASRQPAED